MSDDGRRLAAVLVAAIALSSVSCGYALVGRGNTLPSTVRIIGVPLFENRSPTPEIDVFVTEETRREFQGRGERCGEKGSQLRPRLPVRQARDPVPSQFRIKDPRKLLRSRCLRWCRSGQEDREKDGGQRGGPGVHGACGIIPPLPATRKGRSFPTSSGRQADAGSLRKPCIRRGLPSASG